MLALGVVLGLVQIVAASHAASLQRGYLWTSSPRDEPMPPLRGVAGRLDRALRNFLETFPLFVAVVLAVHVSETHNALTEWGGAAVPLGTRRLRAALRRRRPARPLACLERRDDRHSPHWRRPVAGMNPPTGKHRLPLSALV